MTRNFAFLEALFTKAITKLQTYERGTVGEVALQWYKWLEKDATSTAVGPNRTAFYDQVIERAKYVCYCSALLIMLMGWPARGIETCRSWPRRPKTSAIRCPRGSPKAPDTGCRPFLQVACWPPWENWRQIFSHYLL